MFYAILSPLSGVLALAFGLFGDYATATWLAALSGVAALGAMVRNGR